MKTLNRLDPDELSQDEIRDVELTLAAMFPSAALVNPAGERMELPQPIFDMLVNILRQMQERRAIVLVHLDEVCTTQAAADYLGVSRPFLVSLLEKGVIPYHPVGSHRRITMRHILDYEAKRDKERKDRLERLSTAIQEAGLDDSGELDE